MGFDEGRVIFDNETGTYNVGQAISGMLVFDQRMPIVVHEIYASFVGFCKVQWTEDRTNHEGSEQYVNQKFQLFGDSNGKYQLMHGHHEYRFQFHIPMNCPSSFESEHGHIKYQLKAVLVMSAVNTKEKMFAIKVHSPVDINTVPEIETPFNVEVSKTFTSCCGAETAVGTLKLPSSGLIPGTKVSLGISINNQTSYKVKNYRFGFIKVVTYKCPSGSKNVISILGSYVDGPIKAYKHRKLDKKLDLPETEVYNLKNCKLITSVDIIRTELEFKGHEAISELVPITFGSFPLKGSGNQYVSNSEVSGTPTGQPTVMSHSMSSSLYGNYPQNTPYFGMPNPAPQYIPYANPINQPYPSTAQYPQNPPQYPVYPGSSPAPAQPLTNTNITVTLAAPNAAGSAEAVPVTRPETSNTHETALAPAVTADVPATAGVPATAPAVVPIFTGAPALQTATAPATGIAPAPVVASAPVAALANAMNASF